MAMYIFEVRVVDKCGYVQVEVWMQTIAPGNGTLIHRHDMEEVLVIVKGHGTVQIAPKLANNHPGEPVAYAFGPNSTFIVPVNARHQVSVLVLLVFSVILVSQEGTSQM